MLLLFSDEIRKTTDLAQLPDVVMCGFTENQMAYKTKMVQPKTKYIARSKKITF